MRTILFRGKLSHSNRWVYGNLVIANNDNPYIIPSNIFDPDGHHLRIDSDEPWWVDPSTIGQFTGLTDKNGNKIFEGDIIHCFALSNDHNQRTAIDISPVDIYNGNACLSITHVTIFPFCITHDIVIIGNIHDNPELI